MPAPMPRCCRCSASQAWSGFGAVVAALPAFALVRDWVLSIGGGPLVSLAVATNILAALTGSASGGLTIALDALGATYMRLAAEQGIDPALMHRVAVIGAGTLDSLPHNGAVVTLLAVCGSNHRESYLDIVDGRDRRRHRVACGASRSARCSDRFDAVRNSIALRGSIVRMPAGGHAPGAIGGSIISCHACASQRAFEKTEARSGDLPCYPPAFPKSLRRAACGACCLRHCLACSPAVRARRKRSRRKSALCVALKVQRESDAGIPVSLTGRIAAEDEVSLAFRISGRMIKMDVNVGDRLDAGTGGRAARFGERAECVAHRAGKSHRRAGPVDAGAQSFRAAGHAAQAGLDHARQSRSGGAALQTAESQAEAAEAQLKTAQDLSASPN